MSSTKTLNLKRGINFRNLTQRILQNNTLMQATPLRRWQDGRDGLDRLRHASFELHLASDAGKPKCVAQAHTTRRLTLSKAFATSRTKAKAPLIFFLCIPIKSFHLHQIFSPSRHRAVIWVVRENQALSGAPSQRPVSLRGWRINSKSQKMDQSVARLPRTTCCEECAVVQNVPRQPRGKGLNDADGTIGGSCAQWLRNRWCPHTSLRRSVFDGRRGAGKRGCVRCGRQEQQQSGDESACESACAGDPLAGVRHLGRATAEAAQNNQPQQQEKQCQA